MVKNLPIRVREELAHLPEYRQGKPAPKDAYKLSSNENPFEPLPSVLQAIDAALDINRYPDASKYTLKKTLAERFSVTEEELILGAGSVSLLTQLLLAVAKDHEVVYSWRSFEAYPIITLIAGGHSVQVPNLADGSHDLDAMAEAVTEKTRAIIVCSPNNPTGRIVKHADFEAFMSRVPEDTLVILDEAYVEFCRNGEAVDGSLLIGRYPNLVILRTFSKAYGLAGLRIGYGIGHPEILKLAALTMVPLGIIRPAVMAAEASLLPEAEAELISRVEHIVDQRERLFSGLAALEAELSVDFGIEHSESNFFWIPVQEYSAEEWEEAFLNRGIVVRAFPEGVRVTIGEDETVETLLNVLRDTVETLRNRPSSGAGTVVS